MITPLWIIFFVKLFSSHPVWECCLFLAGMLTDTAGIPWIIKRWFWSSEGLKKTAVTDLHSYRGPRFLDKIVLGRLFKKWGFLVSFCIILFCIVLFCFAGTLTRAFSYHLPLPKARDMPGHTKWRFGII